MIGVVHGTGKLFFMTFCSDVQVEPLPGTAKKESVFVLFEWPNGWSRDILDGGTFGPELTAQLKAKLKGVAGLQLIRKPGKEGRVINGQHRCYVVWAEQGVCKEYLLDGPADILGLDLGAPLGDVAKHPLVLICTHGRRDVCCAVKGRALAAELAAEFPDVVWETSHTKGHRFAPSILLMPWGYSFGRLNIEAARELVRAAQRGEYFYPGNRGCGLYGPRGQVAELAVARGLIEAGERVRFGQLRADDAHVRHADGREWRVELQEKEVSGVVSSCGDEPKTSKAWHAVGVHAGNVSGA